MASKSEDIEADSLKKPLSPGPSSSSSVAMADEVDAEKKINRTRAGHASFLILGFILALIARDGFWGLMDKIPVLNDCGDETCKGYNAVYRISFGLMVFYLSHIFAASRLMCCASIEARADFQNAGWFPRFGFFAICMVFPFFIPNNFFHGFAYFATVASSLYLLMQILILIDFAYTWNENWVAQDKLKSILAVCFTLFALAMTAIILMYTWFVGDGSNGCHLHKFAVSITLVLFLLYLILSVKVEHGALLPTMVVFAYTASLCWSALQSSPDLATCDTRAASNRGSAWDTAQLVIGAIFVAASLCYSSLSAGSSRSSFALSVKPDTSGGRAEQVEEELAAFAFSHIMMTLASIYMSMLLTGWQIVGTSSALNVDQGAGSFWVKLCSEWATCLMYMWSLAAPLIFKDRDFGLGNSA